MKIFTASDFDYALPPELVAKYPLSQRSESRLLVVDRRLNTLSQAHFVDFIEWIDEKDLIVFNNTKVIPARLLGHKISGGKVECLIERVLSEKRALAHLRASKPLQMGSEWIIADDVRVRILGKLDGLFDVEFLSEMSLWALLQAYGEVPLPPYLNRASELSDRERYQTIFAEQEGSVAAPTASLHFDAPLMERLAQKGVSTARVTLHIGAGTFQPVRVEALSQHIMHKEYLEVPEVTCQAIRQCKARGGRVIAVGTTVVRCLETAAAQGEVQAYQGETQIFIYPGYSFHCVDVLLTNFHLPKSTLLMLVCAFGGYEQVMQAYHFAVENRYRFFSYGDAMMVV